MRKQRGASASMGKKGATTGHHGTGSRVPWGELGLQLAVPEGEASQRRGARVQVCPGRKAEGAAPWTPASSLLELGPEEVLRPWRRGARLWRLLGEGASCTWSRGPAMGERGARGGKHHGCWPCFPRAGCYAWEEESCWRLKEMVGWECKNASTS
jgi:hypothetical protein